MFCLVFLCGWVECGDDLWVEYWVGGDDGCGFYWIFVLLVGDDVIGVVDNGDECLNVLRIYDWIEGEIGLVGGE